MTDIAAAVATVLRMLDEGQRLDGDADPTLWSHARAALATIEAHIAAERKARKAVESLNAEEVLRQRTNLEAMIESQKAHIAEIERERDEARQHHRMAVNKIHLEAGETKVQARRAETAEADLLLAAKQNTGLSERLDRLEGALRPLREYAIHQANAPIRPIWYRIYRSPDYDPTNAEARVICERVRELEAAIARAALAEEPYADKPARPPENPSIRLDKRGNVLPGEPHADVPGAEWDAYAERLTAEWLHRDRYADIPGAGQRGCG